MICSSFCSCEVNLCLNLVREQSSTQSENVGEDSEHDSGDEDGGQNEWSLYDGNSESCSDSDRSYSG